MHLSLPNRILVITTFTECLCLVFPFLRHVLHHTIVFLSGITLFRSRQPLCHSQVLYYGGVDRAEFYLRLGRGSSVDEAGCWTLIIAVLLRSIVPSLRRIALPWLVLAPLAPQLSPGVAARRLLLVFRQPPYWWLQQLVKLLVSIRLRNITLSLDDAVDHFRTHRDLLMNFIFFLVYPLQQIILLIHIDYRDRLLLREGIFPRINDHFLVRFHILRRILVVRFTVGIIRVGGR